MDKENTRYQLTDAMDIDDLVLWCSRPPSYDILAYRLRGELLSFVVERALHTDCYLGPIGSQTKVDTPPNTIRHDDLPIIYHLHLTDEKRHIAFVYVTEGTVELHFPECFFVTGDVLKDKCRLAVGLDIANNVAHSLNITWDNLEYAGDAISVDFSQQVWLDYEHNLTSRIDYGPENS